MYTLIKEDLHFVRDLVTFNCYKEEVTHNAIEFSHQLLPHNSHTKLHGYQSGGFMDEICFGFF